MHQVRHITIILSFSTLEHAYVIDKELMFGTCKIMQSNSSWLYMRVVFLVGVCCVKYIQCVYHLELESPYLQFHCQKNDHCH